MDHQIPYIVHEADMARMERTNKRAWILSIILIVIIITTNAGWLWYESQFDYYQTEITQENENGYNNYIGNDGDIYNGEADSTK